jgi:hypothetical protein
MLRLIIGVLSSLNSVNNDRATRLEKSQRAFTKPKWIRVALHEADDLVCKICGAHIIGLRLLVRLFLVAAILFSSCTPPRFDSRSSRKRTGAIHALRHAGNPRYGDW